MSVAPVMLALIMLDLSLVLASSASGEPHGPDKEQAWQRAVEELAAPPQSLTVTTIQIYSPTYSWAPSPAGPPCESREWQRLMVDGKPWMYMLIVGSLPGGIELPISVERNACGEVRLVTTPAP